jgi:hypothetical protein
MSNGDRPTLFRAAVGKRGMTALHFAAYCGDLAGLEQQLRDGADPNLKDEYRGYTALHWLTDVAAAGGQRLEMLNLLVAHGARLDVRQTTALPRSRSPKKLTALQVSS